MDGYHILKGKGSKSRKGLQVQEWDVTLRLRLRFLRGNSRNQVATALFHSPRPPEFASELRRLQYS